MADSVIWSQRVLVLRHGERRDHAPDAPPDFDPPLTAAGKAAIPAAAVRIQKLIGVAAAKNAVLVVSPFTRCVETAMGLRAASVGSESPYVVDNGVCEVYGPVRIKHPERPLAEGRRATPPLPKWGETLADATQRYVASFLRIADAYAPSASSMLTRRLDSESVNPVDIPEAVTNRARLPLRRPELTRTSPDNERSLADSCSTATEGRDVIIVTHGDALSAVLSHFYPSRTVYEAEYLSFLVMKRYGVGNTVFHLDDSVGVHWILDGPDEEPRDPIWRAHRDNAESTMSLPSGYGPGGYFIAGVDEFSDEAEEGCGTAVPLSSVKRTKARGTGSVVKRASVTAHEPREFTMNARAAVSRSLASPPSMASASVPSAVPENGHIAHGVTKRTTVPTLTSPTTPTLTSPNSPGKTHHTKNSHGHGHPKGSEDCEGLYSPDSAPSQSSEHGTPHSRTGSPPTRESHGQPNQPLPPHAPSANSARSAGVQDSATARAERTHEEAQPHSAGPGDLSDLVVPLDDHRTPVTCSSLARTCVPFRRSCLLRTLQCLSQALIYIATDSTLAATCFFVAAILTEAIQGVLLFLSTLRASANHVRHVVEYLLYRVPWENDESEGSASQRYRSVTTFSNSPSVASRTRQSTEDHVDAVPSSDNDTSLYTSGVASTFPTRSAVVLFIVRHLIVTAAKLGCTFLVTFILQAGRHPSAPAHTAHTVVHVLTRLLYVALNVTRGMLDELSERASILPSGGRHLTR